MPTKSPQSHKDQARLRAAERRVPTIALSLEASVPLAEALSRKCRISKLMIRRQCETLGIQAKVLIQPSQKHEAT